MEQDNQFGGGNPSELGREARERGAEKLFKFYDFLVRHRFTEFHVVMWLLNIGESRTFEFIRKEIKKWYIATFLLNDVPQRLFRLTPKGLNYAKKLLGTGSSPVINNVETAECRLPVDKIGHALFTQLAEIYCMHVWPHAITRSANEIDYFNCAPHIPDLGTKEPDAMIYFPDGDKTQTWCIELQETLEDPTRRQKVLSMYVQLMRSGVIHGVMYFSTKKGLLKQYEDTLQTKISPVERFKVGVGSRGGEIYDIRCVEGGMYYMQLVEELMLQGRFRFFDLNEIVGHLIKPRKTLANLYKYQRVKQSE